MKTVKGENISYNIHNNEYEHESDLEWHKVRYAEYEKNNNFENEGFKKAIDDNPALRELHIDLGSGAGWLLCHTAPIFKKVIGVEPSTAAVAMSKYFTKDYLNVEYLNTGMIEGLEEIKIESPAFFTTAIVLSHIKNETVSEFLRLMNQAPVGSVLFFFEPYGKNIQQYMWHVRSKSWWAHNLSNWDLEFCGYRNVPYAYGIYGKRVESNHNLNKYNKTLIENLIWFLSGLPSRLKYVGKLLLNFFQ
jgi:hypothetical protein